eukprot:CAMPEP_0115038970 /NCGR_PEP_ID=MMETSP0216-20121206/43726_1 /TAXON_ID=223996 /ORGANISM="Protocruzia adherens, Strain Boccale" /LENGTH=593 /DNA_ID=CAMNT_0002419473 /DNA_START=108 /DNA_END=1889 /DNA_ORIENTATION=+
MEAFENPAQVVTKLFESVDINNEKSLSGDWGIKEYYDKALKLDRVATNIDKVPCINFMGSEEELKSHSGKLVCYRGMIQDMLETEYFIGLFADKSEASKFYPTKYLDDASLSASIPNDKISMENPKNVTMERQPLFCTNTPAENQWSTARASTRYSNGTNLTPNALNHLKLKHSPTSCGPQCVVKVYGDDGKFKLGDTFEFFGVLSWDGICHDKSDSQEGEEEKSDLMMDFEAAQELLNKLPTLHCVTWKRVRRNNGFVTPDYSGNDFLSYLRPRAQELRANLLEVLRDILGGDELAAEYVFKTLLSRVKARKIPFLIGKVSVNVSNVPAGDKLENKEEDFPGIAESLNDFVSKLLQFTQPMPLDLESLNGRSLVPKKDYTKNWLEFNQLQLVNGLEFNQLQLVNGTTLVVDETKMKTGNLNETGIRNLQALKTMVETQTLSYDFQYYVSEMPVDLQVLILSEGTSLLAAEIEVPLKTTGTFKYSVGKLEEDENLIDLARKYFAILNSDDVEVEISEEVCKFIENDFVELRKTGDKAVDAGFFHQLLTLTKIEALSYGEESVSQERYLEVKKQETERLERIKAKPTKGTSKTN